MSDYDYSKQPGEIEEYQSVIITDNGTGNIPLIAPNQGYHAVQTNPWGPNQTFGQTAEDSHQSLKQMWFVNKQGIVGQVRDVVDGICAVRWMDGEVSAIHGRILEEEYELAGPDDIVKARKELGSN